MTADDSKEENSVREVGNCYTQLRAYNLNDTTNLRCVMSRSKAKRSRSQRASQSSETRIAPQLIDGQLYSDQTC